MKHFVKALDKTSVAYKHLCSQIKKMLKVETFENSLLDTERSTWDSLQLVIQELFLDNSNKKIITVNC